MLPRGCCSSALLGFLPESLADVVPIACLVGVRTGVRTGVVLAGVVMGAPVADGGSSFGRRSSRRSPSSANQARTNLARSMSTCVLFAPSWALTDCPFRLVRYHTCPTACGDTLSDLLDDRLYYSCSPRLPRVLDPACSVPARLGRFCPQNKRHYSTVAPMGIPPCYHFAPHPHVAPIMLHLDLTTPPLESHGAQTHWRSNSCLISIRHPRRPDNGSFSFHSIPHPPIQSAPTYTHAPCTLFHSRTPPALLSLEHVFRDQMRNGFSDRTLFTPTCRRRLCDRYPIIASFWATLVGAATWALR